MISEFFFSEPLNLLFVFVDFSSDDADINNIISGSAYVLWQE